MTENEILIRVRAELNETDKVTKKFQILQTAVKELDYAFRQNKITADQLRSGLAGVQAQADKLKLSYKQTVDLSAQMYHVTDKASNGFKSLASELTSTNEMMRKTNPSFISFNQIIQDSPFGLRGMGNNIQFLTQQFTMLRASGMSTGAILRGMIGNIFTPLGLIMTSVSVVTAGLQMLFDSLAKSSDKAKQKIDDLTGSIADLQVELGIITEEQYMAYLNEQIAKTGAAADKAMTPTSMYFEQIKSFGLWLVNNPIGKLIWAFTYYGIFKPVQLATQGYLGLVRLLSGGAGVVAMGEFTPEEMAKADKATQESLQAQEKAQKRREELARKKEEARKKRVAEEIAAGKVTEAQAKFEEEANRRAADYRDNWEKKELATTKEREETLAKWKKAKEEKLLKEKLEFREAERKTEKEEQDKIDKERQKEAEDAEKERVRKARQAFNDTAADYEMLMVNPMLSGMDRVAEAWNTKFESALQRSFRGGKTVMDQFIIGLLSGLNQAIERALMMQAIFTMLNLIPGGGDFAEALGFRNVLGNVFEGKNKAPRTMGSGGRSVSESYTSGLGASAMSRNQQNMMRNVHITGTFIQRGGDLVAVVENTQLRRDTRSMSIAKG